MLMNIYDQDIESSRIVRMLCHVFFAVAVTLCPISLSPEISISDRSTITR
jgi:hypothetical protein